MPDYIKKIQAELAIRGLDPGPIDGLGGPKTATALEKLLLKNGIRVAVLATATAFTLAAPRPIDPVRSFPVSGPGPITASQTSPGDMPWMLEARAALGKHETRDKTWLSAFLKSDGRTLGDPTKLPWCGDFVETCIRLALPAEEFPGALASNPYWARNWALFGLAVAPVVGAVLVFERSGGGGHVGFAVGADANHYYVLGGNQSNGVTVARIEKGRCLASRWPATYPRANLRPLPTMNSAGVILSTNEL